jgi:hypothetical protein
VACSSQNFCLVVFTKIDRCFSQLRMPPKKNSAGIKQKLGIARVVKDMKRSEPVAARASSRSTSVKRKHDSVVRAAKLSCSVEQDLDADDCDTNDSSYEDYDDSKLVGGHVTTREEREAMRQRSIQSFVIARDTEPAAAAEPQTPPCQHSTFVDVSCSSRDISLAEACASTATTR